VSLTQTAEGTVYFDPVVESGLSYVSPVQTYLELASGDKRQREAAGQVREYLLRRSGRPGKTS
jgi:hypothetical protein